MDVKTKKVISILLAAVLCLTLLAGCGVRMSGGNDSAVINIIDGSESDGKPAPGSGPDERADSGSDRGADDGAGNDDIAGDDTTLGDLDDFSAETIDGGSFTDADFSAYDVTMINFWSTTCGPCIQEMPELEELRGKLPANVQLITVCLDGDYNTDDARAILDMTGWSGVTITSFTGDMEDIYYNMMYTPTTLCFDSEGRAIGSAIIGSPHDAVGTYGGAINSLLSAMGKDTFQL